ncbi:unnamed protein product [Phytomonas sp. EM1]|nr:unnamed protein product [Phytomonas sp. EM1]|eukprot:CCW65334.1 unnamed protein product [Phytomonas sp. isolate EM1]
MEIHIFDFDGTLFFSPTPNRRFLRSNYDPFMFGRLQGSLSTGGFGWYQSLSTLSPPAVPAEPAESRWYVTPVVNWFRSLIEGKVSSCNAMPDKRSEHVSPAICFQEHTNDVDVAKRLFFVLTGRHEGFRSRIECLLDHIGLLRHIEHVFLKPYEGPGTVEYKLNTFLDLILRWKPQRVFYYEDRYDQGAKLLEGMEQLQSVLSPRHDSDTHLCSLYALLDANALKPGLACVIPSVPDEPSVASFSSQPHYANGNRGLANSDSSANSRRMITREDLYGGDISRQRQVARYIRRWLEKTIHERNNAFRQERLNQSSEPLPGTNGSSRDVEAICDTKELNSTSGDSRPSYASTMNASKDRQKSADNFPLESIQFCPPLNFSFTMVMTPNEISSRSCAMLTQAQQSVLIATLIKEREAYDALRFHPNGSC